MNKTAKRNRSKSRSMQCEEYPYSLSSAVVTLFMIIVDTADEQDEEFDVQNAHANDLHAGKIFRQE